jgi:hypothetical protein
MRYEEFNILSSHPTKILDRMLQEKISLLNSLAEEPELEDHELGFRFVDAEWPEKLREIIVAIKTELARRSNS